MLVKTVGEDARSEDGAEEIAGVPIADEADDMDAMYGYHTGKYNLRNRKPRSYGHLHSLIHSETSKDGELSNESRSQSIWTGRCQGIQLHNLTALKPRKLRN